MKIYRLAINKTFPLEIGGPLLVAETAIAGGQQ